MTRLLLDTTFLIDAERGESDLDGSIAGDDHAAIAAITLAEVAVGVELASTRRRSARQAFLDHVVETMPVLDYGVEVALEHAALMAATRATGRPRGSHDLIIAATARAFDRTIVSADRSAFDGLPGVRLQSRPD